MREKSIDEFESVFERASIPVLDIHDVPITRVTAVVKNDPLDESVLAIANYLHGRFGAETRLLFRSTLSAEQVRTLAAQDGVTASGEPFRSTAELVGQISIANSRLVLLPVPSDEDARFIDLDTLVTGTAPPILTIRTPVADPTGVFRNILHSLTGNFRQTQNFAYSFTLIEDDGRLLLLHAIDTADVQDVRETLRVSPDIADETGDALIESLARHGERYLKGVVAAGREHPFDVQYHLAVGDIVSLARDALADGAYTLLVVGSHEHGQSRVSADDYQLLHQVTDIPVLAL